MCSLCHDLRGRIRRADSVRYAPGIHSCSTPVWLAAIPETIQQHFVEPLPDAGLIPVAQTAPAGHATAAAELPGQHLPGDAGEDGAIRDAGPSAAGFGRFGR